MSKILHDIINLIVLVINPGGWYLDYYGSISSLGDVINIIVGFINLSILGLVIYGSICAKINAKKGYSGGFAWGLLGIIGIIVVACRKTPLKLYSGTMLSHPSHPYRKLGGFLMYDVVSRVLGSLIWIGIGIIELVMYIQFESEFKQIMYVLFPVRDRDLITALYLTLAVLFVIAFIIDLIQLIMILSRSKWFLMFYQLMLIFCIITAMVIFVIWIIGVNQGYQNDWTIIVLDSLGLILFVIKALLWSHYYSHSVRVRIYMGSSDYLRKSIFNRRTMSPIPESDENRY